MQASNMCSFIVYVVFNLLFTPSSARTLYSSSLEDSRSRADTGDAVQIISIPQKLQEQLKSKSAKKWQWNYKPGIDLDYLAQKGEYYEYLDVEKLLDLVKKNYAANRGVWSRVETTPRVYYISNPEVLEEYWKTLQNRQSSVSSDDRGGQYGSGIDANLLKYITSLRRDDNDYDDDELEPGTKRQDNDNDLRFKGTVAFGVTTTADSYESIETKRKKSALRTTTFKSQFDEIEDNNSGRKSIYKTPAKVMKDDEAIMKTIANFKNAWKLNKNVFKESIGNNNNVPPQRIPQAGKLKNRFRSKVVGNNVGYHPYGRSRKPMVVTRNVYEED